MDKKQNAYKKMAKKTIGETLRHKAIWEENTVFSDTVNNIDKLFEEINITIARQNRTTGGLTTQKNKSRKILNNTTNIFLGIFRSNAKTIGDENLFDNSDKSLSDIKYISNSEIISYVDTIIAYANTNIEALKEYGISEEMIARYGEEAKSFTKYYTAPQEIIAEKKTATLHLKKLFKQLDLLITEHLDNHIMQYKDKERQFYQDYLNARTIFDEPTITKSMMGKVLDEETGLPLENVKVTVIFKNGLALATYTKTTTAKGNFQFKGLPSGKCKVTFEFPYYDILEVDSVIFDNTLTRLNVAIKKTV
jgi:hypothetical protein